MNKLLKIFIMFFLLFCMMCVSVSAISKIGSTGSEVSEIQRLLKDWGYYDGAVDGVFGTATRNAVIKFQKTNNLTPDGIVGNETLAALGISGKQSIIRPTMNCLLK